MTSWKSSHRRYNCWSLGMDAWFHPTHYKRCDYLSMLGLKLIHISKSRPWSRDDVIFGPLWIYQLPLESPHKRSEMRALHYCYADDFSKLLNNMSSWRWYETLALMKHHWNVVIWIPRLPQTLTDRASTNIIFLSCKISHKTCSLYCDRESIYNQPG